MAYGQPMSFTFNLRKRPNGKYSIRMRSYAIEDRLEAGKPDVDYVENTLPEHQWGRYGFSPEMSIDETVARMKVLNATTKARDVLERKARFKYVEQKEHKDLLKSAYLPDVIVTEFEKMLKDNSFAADYVKSKTHFHWKTTMRLIARLEMGPHEWHDNKRTIIKALEGYAPSTVAKLLSLLNQYGEFYSMKIGKFYKRVSMPRGVEVGRISDKYLDKTGGRTKEAKGVSLSMMEIIYGSDELSQANKDWCAVCLGFGLRPSEVDAIATRDSKAIQIGKGVVKIYQSKLVSLPRNMRFKEVKISHPFQQLALAIFKSKKELKCPTIHMLRKLLGDDYGLYSFRKGYTEIMITLGEPIDRISSDLGHSSIDRTWRSYRKRITLTKD